MAKKEIVKTSTVDGISAILIRSGDTNPQSVRENRKYGAIWAKMNEFEKAHQEEIIMMVAKKMDEKEITDFLLTADPVARESMFMFSENKVVEIDSPEGGVVQMNIDTEPEEVEEKSEPVEESSEPMLVLEDKQVENIDDKNNDDIIIEEGIKTLLSKLSPKIEFQEGFIDGFIKGFQDSITKNKEDKQEEVKKNDQENASLVDYWYDRIVKDFELDKSHFGGFDYYWDDETIKSIVGEGYEDDPKYVADEFNHAVDKIVKYVHSFRVY